MRYKDLVSCYCSSKNRKSESNSQLDGVLFHLFESCYCSSKTRKSESNSQPHRDKPEQDNGCYCSSNTRKSESNSQHDIGKDVVAERCYCSSKTNKIRLFGNTKTANILEIPFLLPSNNHELIFMMPRLDILR